MINFLSTLGSIVIAVVTVFSTNHKTHTVTTNTTTNIITATATPTTEQMKEQTLNANGSISMYGKTVMIHLLFPKNGGEAKGEITGACEGLISGTYSGGETGTLVAKTNATCPTIFTAIQATANFSGQANLSQHSLIGNYTAQANGITKSGSLTLTLSN